MKPPRFLAALTLLCVGCSSVPRTASLEAPAPRVLEDVVAAPEALVTPVAVQLPAPVSVAAPAAEKNACSLPIAGAPILERSDPTTRGRIALTFDDGPHIGYTPPVLDLLAEHELRATFFFVGQAINRRTFTIVKRAVAEGHAVGVHGYDHDIEMATRYPEAKAVEFIVGQHEAARILIEISIMAESEDDFDAMFTRVFDKQAFQILSHAELLGHAKFSSRYAELLEDRGYSHGERPYPIIYSRPPGGGPYLGTVKGNAARISDVALDRLGMINVMWHGGSGDTDKDHRKEVGFLVGNMASAVKKGGILLLHDAIRKDALATSLTAITSNPDVKVVGLDHFVEAKFSCRVPGVPESI